MTRCLTVALALVLSVALGARAEEEDPLEKGRALLGGPQHAEGVTLLRRAIEDLMAGDLGAPALHRIGRAHFYLEEDREAIKAFRHAAELEPENAEHRYWLGLVWKYSDLDKALEAFRSATTLDPTSANAWHELGRAWARKKNAEKAVAALLKASDLAPDDAEIRYRTGVELQHADRAEEAIAHYERALAVKPAFVNAAYNLGLLQYMASRYERALAAWKQAATHAPEDLQVHAKVLQALYALERYEDVEAWRKKILALHGALTEEEKAKRKDFCFDQFLVGDQRVYAYEPFDQEGSLAYLVVFRVTKDGKIVKRVNLELSRAIEELGGPAYVVGETVDDGHVTYEKAWRERPSYPELKTAVIAAIEGKLPVAARSRRSPKGGEIEIGR